MISTVPGNYPKIANRTGGQTLRRAIASYDRGRITVDELAAAADKVTVEAISEQERAGIDIITDGQIQWQDPVTYIAGKLQGYEVGGLIRYFDTNTFYRQPEAAASIEWQGPILVRDYEFARDHASRPGKAGCHGPLYRRETLAARRVHRPEIACIRHSAGAEPRNESVGRDRSCADPSR